MKHQPKQFAIKQISISLVSQNLRFFNLYHFFFLILQESLYPWNVSLLGKLCDSFTSTCGYARRNRSWCVFSFRWGSWTFRKRGSNWLIIWQIIIQGSLDRMSHALWACGARLIFIFNCVSISPASQSIARKTKKYIYLNTQSTLNLEHQYTENN